MRAYIFCFLFTDFRIPFVSHGLLSCLCLLWLASLTGACFTCPVTSNLMLRLIFPILKKFSLEIFLRLEQLKQNQRTFGSVDGDFIKSNRTKNTSKMLRYLLGLIYYSNTIFGNISGKNEVISLYCALKCNGVQDEFFLV